MGGKNPNLTALGVQFSMCLAEWPSLNTLRLHPVSELLSIFYGSDSQAFSLSGVVWGLSFSSTLAPRRRCSEWLRSVTTSVAQARASSCRNGLQAGQLPP